MNKDIKNLGVQLYHGTQVAFSEDEANDLLRKHIIDACGGEWNYYSFQKNKYDVFEIIAEALTLVTNELSRDVFEPIAEFKDTELGSKIDYTVENPELYEVAVIASGHSNLMRQRLLNDKVVTTAFDLGVKIYAEFNEFIAGRINWTRLVDKVAVSFNTKVAELIGAEFATAYTGIDTNLKVQGAMDESKLLEIIQKVESLGQGTVTVYGTKIALAKIPGITTLDVNAQEKRTQGYLSMFAGTKCVELKNRFNTEANKWALENDILYIIPGNVKPILMGFEGDAFVNEIADGTSREDRQLEYLFTRRLHLAVLKSKVWGAYKISA